MFGDAAPQSHPSRVAGRAFVHRLTGVFVIGHDCGHMAFSDRRWVNEVVGHLCLSPTFTG